eukprot:TRINITY_DN16963_c0_g1_i1.p1 TRINITY_DN16963_c0_g1~~TRINITY_DN16963_c0_g1_i1.p1  ORF type:complete len:367 (-),score=65.16 TRINITY_DN16963_c0_g1_i1:52-1152(-)
MSEDTIVIDSGSATIRVGVAGEDSPSTIVSNIIGSSKDGSTVYFGKDNIEYKNFVGAVTYPLLSPSHIEWDELEKVWSHALKLRNLNIKSHSVLLTAQALTEKHQREKAVEVLFEKYGVSGVYLANPAMCALYAYGSTTGVVVDLGETQCTVTPVYEGFILPKVTRMGFCGRELTDYMVNLLKDENPSVLLSLFDRELVREAKEKYGFVSYDYAAELKTSVPQNEFTFSDGRTITLSSSQFKCAEPLFQPSLLGDVYKNEKPLHHQIYHECIMKCNMSTRKELYQNIYLTGGTAMFKMLKERLTKELKELVPKTIPLTVKATDDRYHASWKGGSILGSLGAFSKMLITSGEYKSQGASIIHKKCPN